VCREGRERNRPSGLQWHQPEVIRGQLCSARWGMAKRTVRDLVHRDVTSGGAISIGRAFDSVMVDQGFYARTSASFNVLGSCASPGPRYLRIAFHDVARGPIATSGAKCCEMPPSRCRQICGDSAVYRGWCSNSSPVSIVND
jgi:hypothetical protein